MHPNGELDQLVGGCDRHIVFNVIDHATNASRLESLPVVLVFEPQIVKRVFPVPFLMLVVASVEHERHWDNQLSRSHLDFRVWLFGLEELDSLVIRRANAGWVFQGAVV